MKLAHTPAWDLQLSSSTVCHQVTFPPTCTRQTALYGRNTMNIGLPLHQAVSSSEDVWQILWQPCPWPVMVFKRQPSHASPRMTQHQLPNGGQEATILSDHQLLPFVHHTFTAMLWQILQNFCNQFHWSKKEQLNGCYLILPTNSLWTIFRYLESPLCHKHSRLIHHMHGIIVCPEPPDKCRSTQYLWGQARKNLSAYFFTSSVHVVWVACGT